MIIFPQKGRFKQVPTLIENFIEMGREGMRERLQRQPYVTTSSNREKRFLIANYTAVMAGNFTDWMGKTLPWVRHEFARFAIIDNLRCEAVEDHATMLEEFANYCGACPGALSYLQVRSGIRAIRALFRNTQLAGLYGVALMALLENTSRDFIPVLGKIAEELQCPPEYQKYISVHGEADIAHSVQFLKALEAEASMGYGNECVPAVLGVVQSNTNYLFDSIFGK